MNNQLIRVRFPTETNLYDFYNTLHESVNLLIEDNAEIKNTLVCQYDSESSFDELVIHHCGFWSFINLEEPINKTFWEKFGM